MSIQNNPLSPKVSQSIPKDNPPVISTPPVEKTSSVSERIKQFEQMSSQSGKPSPLPEIDPEMLKQSLDTTPSERLQQESQTLPKPEPFGKVLDQLKQVKSEVPGHDEGGPTLPSQGVQDLEKRLDQERIARFQGSRAQDSVALGDKTLRDHSDIEASPVFETGSLITDLGLKPVNVDELLKNRFAPLERELHQLIMPHKKDAVLLKATQIAQQLSFNANLSTDFTLQLSTMSDDQLKDYVAALVGRMKQEGSEKTSHKYGDQATYADLSRDKKALTDAILKGLKDGLGRTRGEMLSTYSRKMTQNLQQKLSQAGPNSDLVFDLTLKSGDDLRQEMAQQLKMLPKGGKLSDLSPQQRELVHQLVRDLEPVIQRGLPNKAPNATTVVHTENNGTEHRAPDTLTLNGKTYGAPQYLGQGGLGLVILYTNVNDPTDKVVAKSLLKTDERHKMVDELRVHRHAMGGENGTGHDNLVKLRGAVSGSDGGLYMVMDLAGGGDLKKMNKTLGYAGSTGLLTPQARMALIQHFMAGIVKGGQYLQSQNLMHLDNKLENGMLDSDGNVKIGDLGSGQVGTSIDPTSKSIPTTFKPLEWVRKEELTHKTDIFQLGRMLYVMAGGKDRAAMVKVDNEGREELVKQHQEAPDDKPDLDTFIGQHSYLKNSAMFQLMKSMLDNDPGQRPTLEGVLEHSFIKEYNSQQTGFPELLSALMAYDKKVGPMIRTLEQEILDTDIDRTRKEMAHRSNPSEENRRLMDEAQQLLTDKREALKNINSHPEVVQLAKNLEEAGKGIL